jgi:hypothetical protein
MVAPTRTSMTSDDTTRFETARTSNWQVTVITAVFACFLACFLLEYANRSLRYLKYLLPFATAAIVMTAPSARSVTATLVGKQFRIYLVLLAFTIGLSLLASLGGQLLTRRFFEETFFLLGPLICAYLAFPHIDEKRGENYARFVFIGVVVGYLFERGPELIAILQSPKTLLAHLLMSDLEKTSESALSFPFGMFCLYFTFSRKRKWALLSFVFVVLSFKRIAILGTLLLVATYLGARIVRLDLSRRRNLVATAMVLVNAAILALLYLLSRGAFDDLFEEVTGFSANLVTMGRAHIYAYLCDTIGFRILGGGLGATTAALQTQDFMVLNAHSDILKYTLELGPVMATVLMFTFYRLSSRSTELAMLTMFLNVLFISDNVSIYSETMFLFYFLHTLLLHRAIAQGR